METKTLEVSKHSATPRDSALKLPQPNVWMLDLRFNVGLHCSRQCSFRSRRKAEA